MSATASEQAVATMIGQQFAGTVGAADAQPSERPPSKFEFDADFQSEIATRVVRDGDFMRKVGHLVRPEYFENVGEAVMVNIALRFFQQYRQLPGPVAAKKMLVDDLQAKVVRADNRDVTLEAFKRVFGSTADLSNGDFFANEVATFARHQAVQNAIYKAVDLVTAKRFDDVEKEIKAAVAVGINVHGDEYNYWQQIDTRTKLRQDRVSGLLPKRGITTGHLDIDKLLYHGGWGRRELAAMMGGAKAGKTAALLNFSKAASLAGFNVLHVTLEVANEILGDRLDASVSDTLMKELEKHIHDVRAKVAAMQARAGALMFHEYSSGSFSPNQLRALIQRYKSPALMPDGTMRPAIKFDLIVVDYADIMVPDYRSGDAKEDSKSIWLNIRAICQDEDAAGLTATQTNRDGMKATVATATDVADDINKIRTADLVISINITEDDRAANEARLYFAASRNQESGMTVVIKQDISRMKFIVSILRTE